MKLILVIFTILALTTAQNFQSSTCPNVNAEWLGIYAQFVPEINEVCIYTTSFTGQNNSQSVSFEGTPQLVSHTGTIKCQEQLNNLNGNCFYNNGYLTLSFANDPLQMIGQAQTNNIMATNKQNLLNLEALSGIIQQRVDTKEYFGGEFMKAVRQFQQQGFQETKCVNIEGNWFGQYLENTTENTNSKYFVNYDVSISGENISFKGDKYSGKFAGEHSQFKSYSNMVLKGECEDNKIDQLFNLENQEQYYSVISDSMIIMLSEKSLIVLVRN